MKMTSDKPRLYRFENQRVEDGTLKYDIYITKWGKVYFFVAALWHRLLYGVKD